MGWGNQASVSHAERKRWAKRLADQQAEIDGLRRQLEYWTRSAYHPAACALWRGQGCSCGHGIPASTLPIGRRLCAVCGQPADSWTWDADPGGSTRGTYTVQPCGHRSVDMVVDGPPAVTPTPQETCEHGNAGAHQYHRTASGYLVTVNCPGPDTSTPEAATGEWQYGIQSELGWIHEPRGEHYGMQRRWASYGRPEWAHDGSPVTEADVAIFQRPVAPPTPEAATEPPEGMTFLHCRWHEPHSAVPKPGTFNPRVRSSGLPEAACVECGEAIWGTPSGRQRATEAKQ